MVTQLINFANDKNMILELNQMNSKGNYPLLSAYLNKNIEIIKILIDYADKMGTTLELNQKKLGS